MGTIFAPTYANLTMGYHEIKEYHIIHQSYALASRHFENSWLRYLGDCQILLKVNLIKPDHVLSTFHQINNNTQFTMEKNSNKTTLFRYNDKQNWYKNLVGYLQQTNGLETICPVYIKPPKALFNKYPVLSCKKNMHHC